MAKRKFKAESQRLLDMMINSIYTHREIFLRELISNASDAIDKMYYRALSENITGLNREDFAIRIDIDKAARTITITDNGCGMTEEELDRNLGVIANSGSLAFKKEMDKTDDVDVIGQFGVGFYSAFMVAEKVTVLSRAFNADKAYLWTSSGVDGYTIEEGEKASRGTEIVLKLKPNTEEDNYDEFLTPYRLRELIKKYSDYIRYPILMEMEKSRKKEDSDEYESYLETETVNSMVPIWKKNRSEVTKEEYESFYSQKFFDFEKPLRVIHSSTEGASTYNALLFIPGRASYDYYTRDFEKGLQLYSSGVLIMDKCADLLPDHFSFVKGLVDSQDLSLNISREMLQHDRQLKLIAGRLEKKIKSELLSMLKNDRENYETFFNNFGLQLKYGVYSSYGMNNDLLSDLLLFYSSAEKKLTSLEEYVSRMKEEQKYIYYASGDTVEHIDRMPQTELLKDKGFEILYLTDSIDEFALQMLGKVGEKEFKSVADKDLGIESEEEKESVKEENEKHSELFRFMKDTLDGKVEEVRLSSRLKSHPVCISSEGMITLEMEKVINALPANEQKIKAKRVLELNAAHPVFKKLTALFGTDTEKLKLYTSLLYDQAMLMEGVPVEDPVAFANAICSIMAE